MTVSWRHTAQAQATLAILGEADDGTSTLTVSRWAMTKTFTDPGAFAAWLRRVTGKVAA